jgi:hypothetical protein
LALHQGTAEAGPNSLVLIRALESAEKLGFVSGHDFSRAIND